MKEPIYLSVVLSTYNDEKYIAESIQSILDQTYPYFEFIIVNDGSTDKTLDIIKTFEDPRIVIIDKPNTGLIDSLNTGVRASQYDWIARMDGDDVAEVNRFEEEVKYIASDIAVITARARIIDKKGDVTSVPHTPTFFPKLFCKLGIPLMVHPLAIFNKSIWEKVGGYDPYMFKNEDSDLWIKMSSIGKICFLNKYLLRYRRHGENVTSKTDERQVLTQWLRVIKGAHNLNRCLLQEQNDQLIEIVKNSSIYKRNRNKHRSFLPHFFYCIVRYVYVKFNSKIRSTVFSFSSKK